MLDMNPATRINWRDIYTHKSLRVKEDTLYASNSTSASAPLPDTIKKVQKRFEEEKSRVSDGSSILIQLPLPSNLSQEYDKIWQKVVKEKKESNLETLMDTKKVDSGPCLKLVPKTKQEIIKKKFKRTRPRFFGGNDVAKINFNPLASQYTKLDFEVVTKLFLHERNKYLLLFQSAKRARKIVKERRVSGSLMSSIEFVSILLIN